MSRPSDIARWDWRATKRGDTKPAVHLTVSGRTTVLSGVRCKVVNESGQVVLDLDSSTSGITLTTTAAPTWAYTIDAISAASTEALIAGTYSQDVETTDAAGTVKTWTEGTWSVTPQSTDV